MSYIATTASALAPGYPVSFKVYGDHPVQDYIAEGTVTAIKRIAFVATEVSLDNGRTYQLPVTRRVRVYAAFLKEGYASEVANSGPAIDWLMRLPAWNSTTSSKPLRIVGCASA